MMFTFVEATSEKTSVAVMATATAEVDPDGGVPDSVSVVASKLTQDALAFATMDETLTELMATPSRSSVDEGIWKENGLPAVAVLSYETVEKASE